VGIRYTGDTIFAPAKDSRSRMVVGKVLPHWLAIFFMGYFSNCRLPLTAPGVTILATYR
jgi:hypothetical protein